MLLRFATMKPEIRSDTRVVLWNCFSRCLHRSLSFCWLVYLSIAFSAPALSPPLLTSPTNGTVVLPGQLFTVSGLAVEGSVTRLEFYEDERLIRTFPNNPAGFTWSNATIGLHTYRMRLLDGLGAAATSTEVKILTAAPDSLATFFPEFTSTAGVALTGRATLVSNWVRLTPNTSGTKGALWLASKQAVTHGFETIFQFRISDLTAGGADGLAFVVEGTPSPVFNSGIGYYGVTNCLAVEYDTYYNSWQADPNDNHISVQSQGTGTNTVFHDASLGCTTNIANLSDGAVHTSKISYAPPYLNVFLDDMTAPIITVKVDLSSYLYLEADAGWVGFVAGVGGSQENHDILAWSFTRVLDPLPEIQQEQIQPNGTIRLHYLTSAGLHYRVQYSSDLSTWRDAASTTVGTGSGVNWVDTGPPETENSPGTVLTRYYRLRVVP